MMWRPCILRGEQFPKRFQRADRLFIFDRDRLPFGRAFPEIRSGGMHVNAEFLRNRQKLIEFRQAFRLELSRVGIERAVGQEHADTINPEFFHLRESLRVASGSNCFQTCGARLCRVDNK